MYMIRKTKQVSDSAVNNQFFWVFPSDLNDKGTLFGGRALAIVDEVVGYVAMNHGGCRCFTKRCCVEFFAPAKIGDVLIFKSAVNRVWETSMEIGVKGFVRTLTTGEQQHFLSGYSILVAVGVDGQPISVPADIQPITEDEKRRYGEAELRRQRR